MKQISIGGLLVCIAFTCGAQTSETKYYKSLPMEQEVPKEKAKYSNTITNNPDGSITTERKNLKKNLVESRQTLKGEEPVGIWVHLSGRGPIETDYNFPLEYSQQDCPKEFNIKNYFADDPAIDYKAPKFSDGKQFYELVAKSFTYPSKAINERIEGKVELTFNLTKDGHIENIRVKKGTHIVLDKEAVRILKKIKPVSPPKINGQPQTLCVSTSISFRIG